MRGDNRLTIFSSGNGDTILIEARQRTILTDINYRKNDAEDVDNDDVPDFAPDIRAACGKHLDLFVLTHPDEDHLRGIDEIFHLGPPEKRIENPKEGEPKILIDEIWCSSYSANPHYETEESGPLLEEIARRKKLMNTPSGNQDGNRLRILSASKDKSGTFTQGIDWNLHAPTDAEADIPEAEPNQPPNSSNGSSLVIRWKINVGGFNNLVFLGGDTEVEVLERLGTKIQPKDPESLAWHVLVAIHHCSRRSIGRVTNEGKDEEYEHSKDAETALSEQRDDGFVVASSRRVVRGGDSPPSYHAKNRYLKILARQGEVTAAVRRRFLCTGGDADDDTPDHVVFDLTANGPSRVVKAKKAASVVGTATAASGRGGGYGC